MMQRGHQIRNYRLIKLLGQGGMGEVWEAEDPRNGCHVAIKTLHTHLLGSLKIRERFIREGKVLRSLSHPNISGYIDLFEEGAEIFLVMELVEGKGLDDWIRTESGPIPESQAISLLKQMLKGLDHAHRNNIIHRDIKPSNFMVTQSRIVKILDFGIARNENAISQLTKTGTRMGTVLYMSPEQVQGRNLDARSDIYSLGVTFFYMLTGHPPYDEDSSEYEVSNAIVSTPLPRASTLYPPVSARMQALIDRASAKAPDERFQSCAEFLAALDAPTIPPISSSRSSSVGNRTKQKAKKQPPLRRRRLAGGILATLLLGGLAVVIWANNNGGFNLYPVEESPEEVAREFFTALEARNESKAKSLANSACDTQVEYLLQFRADEDMPTYTITGEGYQNEKEAEVPYVSSNSPDKNNLLILKKVDGDWEVSCQKTNLL